MFFRRIISDFNYLSYVKTPLGRWTIHNHSQTILKIKYANEDNCGLSYYNNKKITQLDENNDLEYMYMMGYESFHN